MKLDFNDFLNDWRKIRSTATFVYLLPFENSRKDFFSSSQDFCERATMLDRIRAAFQSAQASRNLRSANGKICHRTNKAPHKT